MVPDDYNRVVLETIDGRPDSDYVNASYVDVSIILFVDK
jgi:protein tyrosine phosphatase